MNTQSIDILLCTSTGKRSNRLTSRWLTTMNSKFVFRGFDLCPFRQKTKYRTCFFFRVPPFPKPLMNAPLNNRTHIRQKFHSTYERDARIDLKYTNNIISYKIFLVTSVRIMSVIITLARTASYSSYQYYSIDTFSLSLSYILYSSVYAWLFLSLFVAALTIDHSLDALNYSRKRNHLLTPRPLDPCPLSLCIFNIHKRKVNVWYWIQSYWYCVNNIYNINRGYKRCYSIVPAEIKLNTFIRQI